MRGELLKAIEGGRPASAEAALRARLENATAWRIEYVATAKAAVPSSREPRAAGAHLRSRRHARRHRLRARVRLAASVRRGRTPDRRLADPPPHRHERRPLRPGRGARDRPPPLRRGGRGDPAPPRPALPRAPARATTAPRRGGAAGRPPRGGDPARDRHLRPPPGDRRLAGSARD